MKIYRAEITFDAINGHLVYEVKAKSAIQAELKAEELLYDQYEDTFDEISILNTLAEEKEDCDEQKN